MRSIRKVRNSAVAGVIEALLLVGLVAIIISMIQLVYIPQVMEQREADHMDQVFNQLSQLKAMVDVQMMTKSSSPISSTLTLGSPKLPYFLTVQSVGRLAYENETSSNITVYNSVTPVRVVLPSLQYLGENSYFVNQEYVLEGGGIIVNQDEGGSVMRANPSIDVQNETYTIVVNWTFPYFSGVEGKTQTEGLGRCCVRTNFSSLLPPQSFTIHPGGFFRIYTKYDAAWNKTMHDFLGIYEKNGYITIYSYDAEPRNYVEVHVSLLSSKDVFLELHPMVIKVQIGPGWVE